MALAKSLLLDGGWLLEKIDILKWGTEILIHGFQYVPFSEPELKREFQLIFRNCKKFYWEVIEEDYDERNTIADVIGFDIYEPTRKAVVNNDLFEIGIDYGELILQKDW